MQPKPQKILVMGTGAFGTSLAQHLARQNHKVTLWGRQQALVTHIQEQRQNPQHVTNFTLEPSIVATHQITESDLSGFDIIVFAVPTQYLRAVLTSLPPLPTTQPLLITASKGIEQGSLMFSRHIISESLKTPAEKVVVLSGPSFATEVMAAQPTCISLASDNKATAELAQTVFHSPKFRCYTAEDPIGVELAGALKNVIAIAAGASIGLGYEQNALAALITRGLAEITRLGCALGAQAMTFNGLSGVGDLFLTCTSTKSRNYTTGLQLAAQKSLESICKQLGGIAEGVTTAKSAYNLARRHSIDTPITEQVYAVLYENKAIHHAVEDLLTREAKPEITV